MPIEAEPGEVFWRAGQRAHSEVAKRYRTKAETQVSFKVERIATGLRKLKCATPETAPRDMMMSLYLETTLAG